MRAAGQKEYVNLAKGLITEVSPLSFPEGATSSELNFVVNKNGLVRERRKGFVTVYPNNSFLGNDSILENLFYWRGSTYCVAILTNSVPETYLRIHAVDTSFSSVALIKIADAVVETQIAELTDTLLITLSNNDSPILLAYDEVAGTITVNLVSLYMRDFELVNDGLTVSENPTSLTDNHKYNLYNSGWFVSKKDENQGGFPLENTVTTYHNAFSKYPSNADSVGVGMITNGSGELTFDPEYVRDAGLGNSLSPRGHYVFALDFFNRTTRLADPDNDGAPSTTLTSIGVVNLSGTPSYNPNVPTGGGNTNPNFDPYPFEPFEIGDFP